MKLNPALREVIYYGVEAKIRQYEEYARTLCHDKIDLNHLIGEHLFGKPVQPSFIVINLEKDKRRLENARQELADKLSISKFFHLKGTDGKNNAAVEQDLTSILGFLGGLFPGVYADPITIDEFSVASDPNVIIQEGPLGCYCSHMRAMIHGHLNFSDYTAVIEDDISITDTSIISTCLREIPDDWDLIFLNSAPKNRAYEGQWYKFTDSFFSSHFYIVRNKSLPRLFRYCYPVTDQIDILKAEAVTDLNIYNITYCAYQKNWITNTQNNLHTIFWSPNYHTLRNEIANIRSCTEVFADKILPGNEVRNRTLSYDLLYDVVLESILHSEGLAPAQEDYVIDHTPFEDNPSYHEILISLGYFFACSKKGVNPEEVAFARLSCILHTLKGFKLHNTLDPIYGRFLKAYAFGSTAHTYLSDDVGFVVKHYDDKFRWVSEGHSDSHAVFDKEVEVLKRCRHLGGVPRRQLEGVPRLLNYEPRLLRLSYCGESLYHNFTLPSDWKDQVRRIFDGLTEAGVYYPEFKMQNILVRDGRISFVDFGVAELDTGKSNEGPCEEMIRSLELIDDRFRTETDPNWRRVLISNFVRNRDPRLS